MAYQKKNLTPEQRSEIARRAQASRKTRGGGRPKGSTNKIPKQGKVMRSIGVYEESYKVFRRLADHAGMTLADVMKHIADGRVKDNPELFENFTEVRL